MIPWMIEIEGKRVDLQELIRLNGLSDIDIMEENGRYYFRADEFDSFAEPRDILDHGTELLKVINGIAQLEIQNWENIRVRGVAREEVNGTRTQFIFPGPICTRSKVSVKPTVINLDDRMKTSSPKSTLESFFVIAKSDVKVEKALRIYGSREHSWSNLYIIYEIIESDVGGKSVVASKGWSSCKIIERFKHTANSKTAAGDDARHGKERTDPPPLPMLLDEAESIIGYMLKRWLRTK